jgi:hypothetical protein
MQYDEEFMLSDYSLIKDSLFRTFSVIAVWDNFLGLNYKHTWRKVQIFEEGKFVNN